MRPLTTLALALLIALPSALADDPEPPDPKMKGKENGPLSVRLVAKKNTYVLDRGGMTAEKYLRAVKDGTVTPAVVDLVVELKNTSKENVSLRVSGSTCTLSYALKGPEGGAHLVSAKREKGAKGVKGVMAPPIRTVVLKPGEKHEIALTAMDNTAVGRPSNTAYWVKPGEYTLTVSLRTSVSDQAAKAKGKAKKGVAINPGVMRVTTLESQPVKITVKEK